MKAVSLSALLLALVLSPLSPGAAAEAESVPERNVPGGVYVWTLPEGAKDIRFKGKPVLTHAGHAFIGIPVSEREGTVGLNYVAADGSPATHTFRIVGKAYTEQHITMQNRAMVDPPEETLARIREESSRQRALYNTHADTFDLSDGFAIPLEGITTSLYGHRRFFNGQPRSPHSGLDIAAPEGTPVTAAAAGKVTLADDLYFNGNTIFLDHGEGLVTMYCHLSSLSVAVGERVTQGQEIGLVGATGRATGPHLHWSVSLNGYRVDPEVFVAALAEVNDAGE